MGMIELKNVSVMSWLNVLANGSESDRVLLRLLTENNIFNYQQLYDFYLGLHDVLKNGGLSYLLYANKILCEIERVMVLIENFNLSARKSDIVKLSNDVNILEIDLMNTADVLDCFNPLNQHKPVQKRIMELNIAKLRCLLTTLDGYSLKNSLKTVISFIGDKKIEMLTGAIVRYDEQVVRLLNDVSKDGVKVDNVFLYKKNERDQIVMPQLYEIYEFLLTYSDNFVFGNVSSDSSRVAIMKNTRPYYKGEIQNKLRDIVSNCVTLNELEMFLNSSGKLSLSIDYGIGQTLVKRLTK